MFSEASEVFPCIWIHAFRARVQIRKKIHNQSSNRLLILLCYISDATKWTWGKLCVSSDVLGVKCEATEVP